MLRFYSDWVDRAKVFLFLPPTNIKTSYMSDIASRVKAIIVDKLGVDENEVVSEASFTNDLGADSLDTVELIMAFEEEFSDEIDGEIPESDAEKMQTVGAVIAYISEKAG